MSDLLQNRRFWLGVGLFLLAIALGVLY